MTKVQRAERRVLNAAMRLTRCWGEYGFVVQHGNGTLAKLLRACYALKKARK